MRTLYWILLCGIVSFTSYKIGVYVEEVRSARKIARIKIENALRTARLTVSYAKALKKTKEEI